MSTDLTFITNEAGNHLRDRFNALLETDTRYFDCLVGYFYISGFHKIYPALESVDKVRILVGLQTDRTAYELWQHAQRDGELNLSHASTKQKLSHDVLDELEKAPDTQAIETGVHKFVEWLRSGKLEMKAIATKAGLLPARVTSRSLAFSIILNSTSNSRRVLTTNLLSPNSTNCGK